MSDLSTHEFSGYCHVPRTDYVIACLLGASIICVDLLVRKLPGRQDFKIQDSSGFLAASLSLSFGVMVSACFTGALS